MSILTSAVAAKVAIALLAGGSLVVGAGFSAFAAELPVLVLETIEDVVEGSEENVEVTDDESTEGDEGTEPAESTEGDESEGDDSEGDDSEGSDSAQGPKIPGPAAYGLCNAFGNGGLAAHSTAFKALASGAAEAGVEEFCASLPAKVKDEESEEGDAEEDAFETDEADKADKGKGKSKGKGKGKGKNK